jgi:hypothetical protein
MPDPTDVAGDSSTGSELNAVEEACREASRTAEPLNGLNVLNELGCLNRDLELLNR